MVTSPQFVPLDQYLSTPYWPDCEYVDGVLQPRREGQWKHVKMRWLMAHWFGNHEWHWDVAASTCQRLHVSQTRVRIPDVVVFRPGQQQTVISEAPLLVIQMMLPDDTDEQIEERSSELIAMGVPDVWIIDPDTAVGRRGHMYSNKEWITTDRLQVLDTPIYLDLKEMFAKLDEPAKRRYRLPAFLPFTRPAASAF